MKALGTRHHRVQWPVRKEWPVAGVENQKTTPAFLNSGQTGNSGQRATPATLALKPTSASVRTLGTRARAGAAQPEARSMQRVTSR